MHSHNNVEQSDQILKTDRHKYLTLPDEYFIYSDKFIIMLITQLESMSKGHLCLLTVVQHRIKLEKRNNQQINYAPFCTAPKDKEFQMQE